MKLKWMKPVETRMDETKVPTIRYIRSLETKMVEPPKLWDSSPKLVTTCCIENMMDSSPVVGESFLLLMKGFITIWAVKKTLVGWVI